MTIFTTQIKDLFGLTTPEMPGDFAGKWMVYFQNFGTIDLWATAVGVISVAIIALTPRFSKKIPGSLIAIVVMTLAVYLLKRYDRNRLRRNQSATDSRSTPNCPTRSSPPSHGKG